MALKGLDIFKLTPKTNCKECDFPTCMAFSMKVAQGAVDMNKCPYLSDDAKAALGEATAPPMKSLKFGTGESELTLGGETVLYRHEKTYVNRNVFAVSVNATNFDEKWEAIAAIDYDRIGERMFVEALFCTYDGDADAYVELVGKAKATGRALILDCADADVVARALEVCADAKPIINGATAQTIEAFVAAAEGKDALVGIKADSLEALHDTAEAAEKAGCKNLVLNVSSADAKTAFADAVQIRRAAIKGQDRTFGYPSIVNVAELAAGDAHMQCALASMFVMRYGSIIVMEDMSYAQALPLFGLRQNIFTDPQKPMTVEPGIYPLNGADEKSPCLTTVDFALTYFLVSGELERSGVPCNLIISDAGGYSVLTSWAAGKFSSSSIAKFIAENGIEEKIASRKLIIPGKVAVLKGELEEKLPGWEIIVGTNEAIEIVNFMKQFA